jgi:voltage-dependent anion channel protein 2
MNRNPGAYKDLGKDASDFLNKNFLEADWKGELNAVAANGATFKTTLTKTDGGVSTSVEDKIKTAAGELTTVIDNNKDIKLTLSKKKVFAGLDATVEASSNTNQLVAGLKVKGTVEYFHDLGTFNSNVSVPFGNGPITSVSSCVLGSKEKGVAVGAEVEMNAVRAQFTRFDTIFTYTKSSSIIGVFTRSKRDITTNALANKAGFNVFHKVANSPSNTTVAFETVYDLKTSQIGFTAATGFKPDDTTTVKARLNNSGVLSLAYTQQLLAPFTVSLFANANLLNVEGPDSIRFGTKLTYQQ